MRTKSDLRETDKTETSMTVGRAPAPQPTTVHDVVVAGPNPRRPAVVVAGLATLALVIAIGLRMTATPAPATQVDRPTDVPVAQPLTPPVLAEQPRLPLVDAGVPEVADAGAPVAAPKKKKKKVDDGVDHKPELLKLTP